MKDTTLWSSLAHLLYATQGQLSLPSLPFIDSPGSEYQGLTKDVPVKLVHSHNDYWREVPLITALGYGIQSVEADIWNFEGDDQLYVGHNLNKLEVAGTLDNLYLDPIYDMLQEHNPADNNTVGHVAEPTPVGVFDTDINATLYLFVDFKTDGGELYPMLSKELCRFREKDWLSNYDSQTNQFTWRPLTIIGTGNTPLAMVTNEKHRDIFFDGLLGSLTDQIDANISPIASASLRALVGETTISGMNTTQLQIMANAIKQAHHKGIKTRVWDTPTWPIRKEKKVWEQLLSLGSDLLNADDLEEAVEF